MKKRYILSVAGISLAAVFFMQNTGSKLGPVLGPADEPIITVPAGAAAPEEPTPTPEQMKAIEEMLDKAFNQEKQEGTAKLEKDLAEKERAKIEEAEKKEKEAQPAQEKPAGLSAVDEKAAANPAGGQTSQGVANLPEPGNNKGGSSAAGASTEGDSGAAMQKFYNDILDAEDKEAGNPAGGQTSQGAADLPEPGNNESNMSTAETGLEEEDQNSKELENPAENEIDIGADFEQSDNQGNENPQQQSLE